ncbi:MAG: hypothetical protein QGI45_12645 [Myxococcota bacterium]|jgi:hypothetical protein|nr:hypothetical protein [Myxococcota bacterium]
MSKRSSIFLCRISPYLAFLFLCVFSFGVTKAESVGEHYSLKNLDEPQSQWLGYVVGPRVLPQSLLAATKTAPYGKYDYCPFLVRAIVERDEQSKNFAMLEIAEESQLVKVGQKIEYFGEIFKVRRITSKTVSLRSGSTTLKCRLFK